MRWKQSWGSKLSKVIRNSVRFDRDRGTGNLRIAACQVVDKPPAGVDPKRTFTFSQICDNQYRDIAHWRLNKLLNFIEYKVKFMCLCSWWSIYYYIYSLNFWYHNCNHFTFSIAYFT